MRDCIGLLYFALWLVHRTKMIDKLSSSTPSHRANFSSVQSDARLYWFALLCSLIGSEIWRHSINQSDAKLRLITSRSPAFSRALSSILVFTLSSHWLLEVSSFHVIGRCDFFDWRSIEKYKIQVNVFSSKQSFWYPLAISWIFFDHMNEFNLAERPSKSKTRETSLGEMWKCFFFFSSLVWMSGVIKPRHSQVSVSEHVSWSLSFFSFFRKPKIQWYTEFSQTNPAVDENRPAN